jgi:hypothetical protein
MGDLSRYVGGHQDSKMDDKMTPTQVLAGYLSNLLAVQNSTRATNISSPLNGSLFGREPLLFTQGQLDIARLAASVKPKKSRKNFPSQSIQVLKNWLHEHLVHPYPNENDKIQLSNATGLSVQQVNNWFVNARKRIWQRLLEVHHQEALAHMQQASATQLMITSDNIAQLQQHLDGNLASALQLRGLGQLAAQTMGAGGGSAGMIQNVLPKIPDNSRPFELMTLTGGQDDVAGGQGDHQHGSVDHDGNSA